MNWPARVAVLDPYGSFTHTLVHYVAELGGHPAVFRSDRTSTEELARYDRLLVAPGPGTPERAGICVPAIRELVGRLPLLGVGLGHQCLAAAFGAGLRPVEPLHGTAAPVRHDGSGVLAGLPDPFLATSYHSMVVDPTTLPPELLVNAWTADGTAMGLRHRAHPAWGVQFHPESVLTPEGKQLLANFLEGDTCATR